MLVEAQLCGLPALVSDRVTRACDMTGLLRYLPLETDTWSQALTAFEPVERTASSRNGCERAAERGFDIRIQAAKLRQRYEALANR